MTAVSKLVFAFKDDVTNPVAKCSGVARRSLVERPIPMESRLLHWNVPPATQLFTCGHRLAQAPNSDGRCGPLFLGLSKLTSHVFQELSRHHAFGAAVPTGEVASLCEGETEWRIV